MKPHATINLPLHGGHAPQYLIKRMVKLSYALSKVIVDEYGEQELLKRLADPLWFQAFGCVLGFDWHSSGVTTVVTGVLKQSLKEDVHGIAIVGGKGKRSTKAKMEIPYLADKHFNLSSAKIDNLLYVSKMTAKVDNAAVQDGYSLYHHVMIFDKNSNWTVVQQGMNPINCMARRYHWTSDIIKSFISDPHSGIISSFKNTSTLNMASSESEENQKISVDLATSDINNLRSSVHKILCAKQSISGTTLDNWFSNSPKSSLQYCEHYEMPRKLDWNVFKKVYDIQPKNYEELVSIPGFGPAAIRALSLVGEIIFGTRASWQDPVKYNFAHGGKDGVPYPIARKTYDKSISYLYSAVEGADMEKKDKIQSLKRLANYSSKLFQQ